MGADGREGEFMAGSYRHVTNDDGTFRGTDLIENGGDFYETVEEMWLMINWLTGGDKAKIHEAWLDGYFKPNCPPSNLPLATFERFWAGD
jgi:hypothetical protein